MIDSESDSDYDQPNNYVRKLDIPDVFKAIITGRKTTAGMKPADIMKYNALFTALKDKLNIKTPQHNILWVGTHAKEIEKYIKEHYTAQNHLNPNSQVHYFNSLANILMHINKQKYKEDCRRLYLNAKQKQKVAESQAKEGLLSDKQLETIVSYPDLCNERDKWIKRWEELRPTIKEPFNESKRKVKVKVYPSNELRTAIIYSLVLAFNTYIPPLRKNVEKMKLHFGSKEPEKQSEQNYLWRIAENHYKIVMNYDKVENKRIAKNAPREMFDLLREMKNITNGKRLCELIEMSLVDFPRDYVLCNLKDDPEGKKPMSAISFNSALATMFKPRKPTQGLLRKAYVNYIYSPSVLPKISPADLEEIAKRMRHSVAVAMASYRKTNAIQDILPNAGPLTTIVRHINIPLVEPKIRKKLSDTAKEYRLKNKEKVKESRKKFYENNKVKVLRNKIINNLNSGAQTKVHKQTVEKYDLKQDKKSGLWS